MTTKRKSGNGAVVPGNTKPANSATWRGFVNVEMTPKQKDAAIQMTTDTMAFWSAVEGVLVSAYRIGIGYSDRENVYTATLTGTGAHDTDEGIAVSARASSPDKALAAAMVKLEGCQFNLSVLFEGTSFRPVDL